jgi:long-subunit acyl-CoA synthetase (AMP-forming)
MEPISLKESVACVEKFAQMKGPHCLLIFEETCAEWMTAALGAMSQSLPVATSYSTLGMSAVAEAINQCNAPSILCNYKDVERVATLESTCPSLKNIIYTRNYVEADGNCYGGLDFVDAPYYYVIHSYLFHRLSNRPSSLFSFLT